MRRQRALLLLLLLTIVFPSGLRAQDLSLNGRVVDPQGGVVVDAQVTLVGAPRLQTRSARTDADGTFTFSGLSAGQHVLRVQSPGFITWSREVGVSAGMPEVTVQLSLEGLIEDVQVSGTSEVTLSTPTPTASRLGLTMLDTPASVAVVSGDLVRELGTQTLVVAKALAPGITSSAPMGNGGNVINARGFTGQNSVKQLFNGMEIYNAGGVVSFPFDPWVVDHIGVLYGPSSVLYGSGAIGGAVNVVARRPNPSQRHNEVAFEIGRFGSYHAAFDSTGPITDRVSYRFDISQYGSSHWVERGGSSSLAVSGSLRFDATNNLRFTISNDFGNQNPSEYLGTPVIDNRPVEGLRFTNYNVDDAELNFTDNWTNVETLWTPTRTTSVHNNTYVMYHDRIYHDVPNYQYLPASDQVRRTQFRDINDTYETQIGSTGFVRHRGRLFGRQNELVVGLDANRTYYHRNDNVRGGSSVVDARSFDPGEYMDFYAEESKPFYRIDVNQIGGFAENRLHVTDRLSAVAGIRRDRYEVSRDDRLTLQTTDSDHGATAWNVGTVFDVLPGFAVYGQYATASDPVNSLASINAAQQAFDLSEGRQVETGVKQSLLGGRVEWTLAAYRIVKEDLLTPSIENPTLTEQVGQQSSRGVEASLAVTQGAWRVRVNGTTLQAEFDEFRASVGGTLVSLAGNVPVNVPEQSANVLVFWDPLPSWGARAVVRYVGRRFANNTNAPSTRVPSYTVIDLGTRWKATDTLNLDLRLDNATDEIYADSGSATAWLLGRPRSLTLSANVLF